jgi:hypothetical protein
MYQQKEGNEDDFFQFIFLRKNPLSRKSVQFQFLNDQNLFENRELFLKEMFQTLLTFFIKSMMHYYGDENNHVNLDNLNLNQIDKLREYFESFGITFELEIYNNREKFLKKQKENQKILEYEIENHLILEKKEETLEDYFFNFQTKSKYYHLFFKILS